MLLNSQAVSLCPAVSFYLNNFVNSNVISKILKYTQFNPNNDPKDRIVNSNEKKPIKTWENNKNTKNTKQ